MITFSVLIAQYIILILTFINVSIRFKGLNTFWLGGNDEAVEGRWEWTTGRCSFSSYRNWFPGEPNNGGGREDCQTMLLRQTGQFGWTI